MSADVGAVHAALADLGVARLLGALGLRGRRSGSQYRIACPIHNGREQNCVVGARDGVIRFVCHSGCGGAGGDALALIAAVRGYDVRSQFGDVLREAAGIAGIVLDGPSGHGTAPWTRPEPREDPAEIEARRRVAESRERVLAALLELCPLGGDGLTYLRDERGLSEATLRAARVGYVGDPEGVRRVLLRSFSAEVLDELGVVYAGEWLAFRAHRLLFPLLSKGTPIYLQGRALGPVEKKQDRWRSMRGGVPALYNVDALDALDAPVLLAEGPIDTLSGVQWVPGVAAVGIFGAGGMKPEWCAPLRGRDVLVALDPDEAGERGAVDSIRMLLAVGAYPRRLALPEGRDLNDWMLAEAAA